ncbi:putative reverse transcriptase domain-containing protein [Tanacetum coccineum]
MKDWASPKTQTEIHQFLGLAGYYRKFIEGFSKIIKSMIKLTQKGVKFDWGDKQEASFQLLKQKLCNAPILVLLEGRKDFVVYCDLLHKELVMTIALDLPKQILNAQTEARKLENNKNKDVGGQGWASKAIGFVGATEIPHWKWDNITMDFVTKLPTSKNVPKGGSHEAWIHVSIICDRDPRFALKFWRSLQKDLGTSLDMSTAYHPQTEGHSERTIKTLEDMLRACVIDFGKGWVNHFPLVEFSYNNSYHASIKAAPFEALYGRKCRSPVCWAERKPMKFQVGDSVMLKVSPWKGVVRFGKRGKVNPRYVRPFKVLEKVGAVAYKLDLPQELSKVHNTFHVSKLKKYYANEPLTVPLDGLHIDDKLHFVEEPVVIMDCDIKRLKQSRIPIVKVRWNSRRGPEFTWEREDQFRKKYPHLFTKTAPLSSAAS